VSVGEITYMLSTYGSYTTRGAQIFQKSTSHLKIITAMTVSQFHTEDPLILGTTIQNSAAWVTWCLRFVQPRSTVVKIRILIFWVMKSYSSKFIPDGALKMEAVGSSTMLVTICETTCVTVLQISLNNCKTSHAHPISRALSKF